MAKHIHIRYPSLCITVIALIVLSSATKECISGKLNRRNENTTLISLDDSVALKILPLQTIKKLHVYIVLENWKKEEQYTLGLDANMGVVWGDMEVTVRDTRTLTNVLKVSWPPILLPKSWTSFHLRLHYQELLQFAVIPREAMEKKRSFVNSQILLIPMAASIRLPRSGVRGLRLRLGSDNISLQYRINCEEEFLASAFASEFGVASNVPFWSSLAWILVGVVIMLSVALAVVVFECLHKSESKLPTIFKLKQLKSSKTTEGTSPEQVSVDEKGKSKKTNGGGNNTLTTPQITMGVVSSRAPSPGHEIDENTHDYINKAFTHDEE